MEIVFRADASSTIGHGHVMRCLALAHALRDDGARCTFVTVPAAGDLRARIDRNGFAAIPAVDLSARTTIDALHAAQLRPDWLIVDHYELDRAWESVLRGESSKIMVIDDRPRRRHDCDVLLDQNIVTADNDLTDPDEPALPLIGVEFALLQPEYRELRQRAKARAGAVRRILISFGGADRFGLTLSSLRAAIEVTGDDVAIDVVIPSGIADRDAIEVTAATARRVTVHVDVPTLAPLILEADLGIGAAGSTSWERLCLGLPSIVIALADNQVAIAKALDALELARRIDGGDTAPMSLRRELGVLVATGLDERWSRRCLACVDGKGAQRVSAVLTLKAAGELHARRAEMGDEARLLRWANDPVTRRDSFSERTIGVAEHHRWFQRVLSDSGYRQFIVETRNGVEVGQVRFQHGAGVWEVHYAVAPEFRGRGIGSNMLGAALRRFRDEVHAPIIGRVKTTNAASQKVFQAQGFAVEHANADTITYARTN